MQMAFDMLPDSMAADDRLLLASMPAKCMCCPQEATLGAQLMRFIDEAKEGGNMGHCIHWGRSGQGSSHSSHGSRRASCDRSSTTYGTCSSRPCLVQTSSNQCRLTLTSLA
jgi:hypothetical protein